MYKITLINMPFANLSLPSIALTQLKSVVEERFGEDVRVRILYLNQEFAHFLGFELYDYIAGALQANNSGLGDWIFRQVAFPDQEDNTAYYFRRYFNQLDEQGEAVKGLLLAKRAGLKRFVDRLIVLHQLGGENLVGFSSMFAQNVANFAMARRIKDRNSEVVTIMGGANCEAPMGPDLARHVDALDFVFSGPALVSLPDFVQHAIDGDTEKQHQIRGVFSRQSATPERITGGDSIGAELPISVPVPLDYDAFLDDLDRNFPDGSVRASLTFETSRGCWWGERSHCTFCGLNGGTMMYRAMPTEQALEQFDDLFTKYGDRSKRFESVDNILPRQYLTEVLPRLSPPEDAAIFYEVKADLKDHEMEILSDANVSEIQPGIESLATSTLKLMGKGTTSFQNVNFLKNCVRYSIKPAWNLLIGFPGEGEDVYAKYVDDMPSLVHLPPPSGAFPVRFDRFSPYYTKAEEYGLELAPYDFYRAIYPFSDEVLANIAYFFEDRNYNAKYLQRVAHWQERLTQATNYWQQRWTSSDNGPKAELYLKSSGGRYVVFDSRDGEIKQHELSELGLELLGALSAKGLGVRHLTRSIDASNSELESELAKLRDLGLLFGENDRYISLVMVDAAADMKRQMQDPTLAQEIGAHGAAA